MRLPRRLLALVLLTVLAAPALFAGDTFRRGDANGTGGVDISDPISLLAHLFSGARGPRCPDAADMNDDGSVDIGDAIYGLGWLFFGRAAPPAPGPFDCGVDPTADRLGACVDDNCGAPAGCLDPSFASTLPAILSGGPKDAWIETALESRLTSPAHAHVLAKLAAPAEETILLETLDGEGQLHSFFLAQIRDGGTRIDASTNVSPVLGAGGFTASEPGAIVEVSVAIDPALAAALASVHGAAGTTGGGGVDEVLDGTTTLFSLESAGVCVQHALYGLLYPVYHSALDLPVDPSEAARYFQQVAAWELWGEIFGAGPAPIVGAVAGGVDGAIAGGAAQGICINTVGAPAGFAADVVAGLTAIAPCFFYQVTPAGEVLLQSPVDFEEFCRCYKQHLAGMNLIADLALGEGKTTISSVAGGNEYRPGTDTVGYNPARANGGRNADGNTARPPSIGLGHELIHALHDRNGTIDLDGSRTDGVLDEEITTVRGENQLRGEQGEPMRTHYGANPVPGNTEAHLDVTNRYDCPCPEEGDGDGDGDGGEGADVNPGAGDAGGDTGDVNPGAGDAGVPGRR